MPLVRVQIEGMQDLIRDIRRMDDRGKAAIDDVAFEGAEFTAPKIRDAIPVGTEDGRHLKDKVKTRKLKRKNKLKSSANVEVGSTAKDFRFAFHLETGHKTVDGKDVPAQPFIRNTIDPIVTEITDRMAEVFIEKVVG